MASLAQGIDWGTQITGSVITYNFAPAGAWYDGVYSYTWEPYEIEQFELAFSLYESFLNITFAEVSSGQDLTLVSGDEEDIGALGFFNPPGEANEGIGAFNWEGDGWDAGSPGTGALEQGGFGFVTIIHELGHGLGLAHPHDDGGSSSNFPGVNSAFGDYGDFDLNQGVWTMMSYNDGWMTNPYGTPPDVSAYGYQGTPMAIDIAVLQDKYGANMSFHTGDNTYVLPSTNGLGTFYSCIWDAGGVDTIVHNGSAPALIDLRAATLRVEVGGGGFLSYADGIFGGFTIANGVVIENATGGSGNDALIGNSSANILNGAGGADDMRGLGGNDTYIVDVPGDVADETGGSGTDLVKSFIDFSLADSLHAKGDIENLTLLGTAAINGAGNALANVLTGNAAANSLFGDLGSDVMIGGGGADSFLFGSRLSASNVDAIEDFAVNIDKIGLDSAIFKKVGAALSKKEFVVNKNGKAYDKNDFVIYNKKTGDLLYDNNGSKKGGAQVFAELDKNLKFDKNDFFVYDELVI